MTVLLLSTRALPAAGALEAAARRRGWRVAVHEDRPQVTGCAEIAFYGGLDVARHVMARYGLVLLEPPMDLLARLPHEYALRQIRFTRIGRLPALSQARFLKPADPLRRGFEPGVYRDLAGDEMSRCAADLPVLAAEPVTFAAEYRCFLLDGRVAATSPYMSDGRPIWKPFGQCAGPQITPPPAREVCRRLAADSRVALPPALVVDVGLIEHRGWAVVEFNPAWCSGLLGANPADVLDVLVRASPHRKRLCACERQWELARPYPLHSRF